MTWDAAIRAMISALDGPAHRPAWDPTVNDDLAAYVIEGGDPGVLVRVDRARDLAFSRIFDHPPEGGHPARAFYAGLTTTPGDVIVRWGRALESMVGGFWTRRFSVDGHYWPTALLAQAGAAYPDGALPFGFFDFSKVLIDADAHPGRLLYAAWATAYDAPWTRLRPDLTLTRLPGYESAVSQLHQWLAPMIVTDDVAHRLHALEMLAPVTDSVLEVYAEQVVAAATSGSAQVRAAAAPLLPRIATRSSSLLTTLAVESKPETRRRAVQALWDVARDDDEREAARTLALADRAASVRAAADRFTTSPPTEAAPTPEAPEPGPVEWAQDWTPELAATVATYVEEARWWTPADRRGHAANKRYTPDEVLDILRDHLTSPEPVTEPAFYRTYDFDRGTAIQDGIERGVLTTPCVVKLLVDGDLLDNDYRGYTYLRWAAELLHEHAGLTLLDLWAHLDAVPGLDAVRVLATACLYDEGRLGATWDPDAVWPFLAHHLDGVLEYWRERRTGHSIAFDSEALFPLLASFPEPPARVVELCYGLALGVAKNDQLSAQDHLANHPEALRRATAALADGNGTVRRVAAEWLGRLGDRGAVPDLAAAFAGERNETVQGALLEALVALGEPLEAHFDLASVDVRAAKALARGLPAAVKWLAADALPEVRRASGSGTVPGTTMLWLITRAVAAKSSVPSALLRACTAQLDARDASGFADRLLALWVAADEGAVRGPSPAAASRGLLALVAACGGPESAAVAARYIRTWHGQRPTQSKALVTMLAHHRDPSAASALVSIAYRFKAPSIERAARQEVQALAERRGWTLDELADRAVETAGFDEAGGLDLSYGPRVFHARLLPDCSIALSDADGKALTSLPTPRQTDDSEAVKEAKKTLAAAKKQLAATVAAQTARLRDAMCVQRVWSGRAWQEDLASHPVMARLVARLVWQAETDGARLTFRLLDDGTLTAPDDEVVHLPDEAEVRIAHDVTLTDDEISAWQQHLADYEVPGLFWQLGGGRPELSQEQAAATSLDASAQVPTATLGRTTTGLGYRRGVVGDSAAFDWFEKEFAALGLTARILLEDGQYIEDHASETTVAGLTVVTGATGLPVPLGELPQVLLAELQHDLDTVTA